MEIQRKYAWKLKWCNVVEVHDGATWERPEPAPSAFQGEQLKDLGTGPMHSPF